MTVDPVSAAFLASFRRPHIICDMDDTLAWTRQELVTALNARFSEHYRADDCTTDWRNSLPPTQSDWLTLFFSDDTTYANVAPDQLAIVAINTLVDSGFDVTIGSDRPASSASATKEWLEQWKVKYSDLALNGPGSKNDYAKSYGTEAPCIVVDDDARKWLTIARAGVSIWSPKRPWTPVNWQNYPNVWVFTDWDQVLMRLGVEE
jgi:hypothetical protein